MGLISAGGRRSSEITHSGYQLADVAGVQLLSMHSNGARAFYHFAVAPFYHDTLRRLVDLDSNPARSENVY